jgi:diguanylate cyclase (GGDEF)-like protein
MCDIDHFKLVNDTYGHQTGDDMLREIALTLSSGIREYDSVGRLGGEEFLVIAPMKAGMDCISVFNRLCSKVASNKISTRSGEIPITLSIGVACVAGENSVDNILEVADAALYRAKNEGRNRVVFNEECISLGEPA